MSRAVDEAARQLAGEVEVLRAENQRLRAALVDPPSFAEAWRALDYSYGTDALEQVRFGWDMAIGALRARTGLTDLDAAEVNRGQGDEGAQAQPPGAAAAPTGQAGGEQSGSAGPPAGPCCEGARRIEDIPGDDTTLVGWWCPEHGTAPCRKLVLDLMRDIVFGPAGRSLLSVPGGVTAAELRAAGFPDVAAGMEGKVATHACWHCGAAVLDVVAACHAHGMGQEDGAADERAAIVGFLRRWFERPAYAGAYAWMLAGTREALAAIERGEHRAPAGSSTAPVSCRCFHAPEQHHDNKLAAGWGHCAEDGCDCPGWRP